MRGTPLETSWPKLEELVQNKLLAYRLDVQDKVSACDFDVPGLAAGLRLQARTLGRCIDDSTLRAQLIELLQEQDAEERILRATDLICIVLEALLFHIHDGTKDELRVGELAVTVNKLRACRGEAEPVTEKAVGCKLKELGLLTRRLGAAGRGLKLDPVTRQLVHRLARKYQVLSVQDGGVVRCPDCTSIISTTI